MIFDEDTAHFDAVQRNLTSVIAQGVGKVACPLCLRCFTIDDLKASRLTRGHTLPRALGNELSSFVCKECNNRTSANEDHLKRYAISAWNLPPSPDERLIVEAFGKRYRGTIRLKKNEQTGNVERDLEIAPEPGTKTPWATMSLSMEIERELKRRRNAGEPYSPRDVVTVRVPFDLSRVKSALLGAAYLDAFMRLGYSFILNSNLDCIREEVLNPSAGRISDIACMNVFGPHQSVFFATAPPELVCIGVSYYNLSVILPAADDRSVDIYERLRLLRGSFQHFTALPFSDVQPVPDRWYPAGRYSITRASSVSNMTQPDLRAIRRIEPSASRSLPALSGAPQWALRE